MPAMSPRRWIRKMNKKRMHPKRWEHHHIDRQSADGIGDVSEQLRQNLTEWAQDQYMTGPGIYEFNWNEITQEGLNMGLSQDEVTQVINGLRAVQGGGSISAQAAIPPRPVDDPGEGFEYVFDESTQQWAKMAKRASVIDRLTVASEFRDELGWTVKGGTEIKVGDQVYVRPIHTFGQVIRIVGDMYKVQVNLPDMNDQAKTREMINPYWKAELELSKR